MSAIIANPISFPNPQISKLSDCQREVIVRDSIKFLNIVESAQSHFYEKGKVIKDAIYGFIETHNIIEKSSFGSATDLIRSQVVVAVKRIIHARNTEGKSEDPVKEIAALHYIQNTLGGHTNIVRLIEICQNRYETLIIMEMLDCEDLYEIVSFNHRLPDDIAREYFIQIINGLNFLHSNGICHRDISLENIMRTSDGYCKIIDFGMCLRADKIPNPNPSLNLVDGEFITTMPNQGRYGKLQYSAPEIIAGVPLGLSIDYFKADIWALSVTLFVMIVGAFPVDIKAYRPDKKYQMILTVTLSQVLVKSGYALDTADFLQYLLQPDPAIRPSLADILAHPWMK